MGDKHGNHRPSKRMRLPVAFRERTQTQSGAVVSPIVMLRHLNQRPAEPGDSSEPT
jgi:hypothetical protein